MLACPRCKTALTSTERKEGELHYCDECGGSLSTRALVRGTWQLSLPNARYCVSHALPNSVSNPCNHFCSNGAPSLFQVMRSFRMALLCDQM